jgi:hypothetical protein
MRESGQGEQHIGRDEIPALHQDEPGGIAMVSDAKNQNVPVLYHLSAGTKTRLPTPLFCHVGKTSPSAKMFDSKMQSVSPFPPLSRSEERLSYPS